MTFGDVMRDYLYFYLEGQGPFDEDYDSYKARIAKLLEIRRVEIGANIRRARERAGWTQQRVADILGTSRPRVHRVETGLSEFGVPELELLSERLGVELRYLIQGEVDYWDRNHRY